MERTNDRTNSGPQMQQGQQPQQGGYSQPGGTQAGGQAQQFSRATPQQGGPSGARNHAASGGARTMPARRDPFEMLRRLDQDVDRLFHDFFGGRLRGRAASTPGMWVPQVEICERGGKLHVYADLPGMKREDVRVTIEGDQLVLQGERRSSEESTQGGYFHSERSYGSFYRAIPLPEGVDPQTVDASFEGGVLDVSFDAPRSQQAQVRQVEIREGGASSRATGGPGGEL